MPRSPPEPETDSGPLVSSPWPLSAILLVDMGHTDGRAIWSIRVFIEANDADAQAAVDAVGRALCPDESHEGYCPVPWTTLLCRFDDLDDEDRRKWQAEFDQDREAAGRAPN